MAEYVINRETISANYNRLRRHVRATPTVSLRGAELGVLADEMHLKLEFLQHSGSFKARGALTHFLIGGIPDAGVVAASGGNHGAAVAYAADVFGARATVFVPGVSSRAKQERIRAFGAELHIVGDAYADALEAANAFAAETGAKSLHAYDQAETLVGQGSVALEFEAQQPDLTTLLVAVGGGGLIGGMAAWYQGGVRLIGVEPETADAARAARAVGRPVDVEVSGIAADSLGARRIGSIAFPLIEAFVEDLVTVSDAAISSAQAMLWDRLRIVAEPGGAAAFAALASGAYVPQAGERVGVLICGANTMLEAVPAAH